MIEFKRVYIGVLAGAIVAGAGVSGNLHCYDIEGDM